MRLVNDIRHDGPGVLSTGSLSGQKVRQAPRETAEHRARRLTEMLEMGWREPGSTLRLPWRRSGRAGIRRGCCA